MLAVSFLQWWYSRGWGIYFRGFRERLSNIADFFSIGLLVKTLFQPFKQVSADEAGERGGLQGSLVAFFDRLLSRLIGFIVRTGLIIFGIISMIITFVMGLVLAIVWPCIPILPVAGIIISVTGLSF